MEDLFCIIRRPEDFNSSGEIKIINPDISINIKSYSDLRREALGKFVNKLCRHFYILESISSVIKNNRNLISHEK